MSAAHAARKRGWGRVVGALSLIALSHACAGPAPAEAPAPTLQVEFTPAALSPPTEGASPTESPSPTAALTVPNPRLLDLAGAVSSERLFDDVLALASIRSRHVNSPGVEQAADFIRASFESAGGRLEVEEDPFPLVFDGAITTQRNIIARLPGSDPALGVILVGAHYDSRTVDLSDADSPAPGADDNATGVAALLEMARLLAHETPRATVLLAAFSAEEVGMVGSRLFLQEKIEASDPIQAVLILDIVGNAAGPDGRGSIRAFSAPPDDSPSHRLAWTVAAVSALSLPGLETEVQPELDRPDRYSDHVPFSNAGIPSVRLIEKLETPPRQHSGLDLPESLDPGYLAQATRLTLLTTLDLANAPAPPDQIEYDADPAAPRLRWSPADGAAAYLVVLRRRSGGQPQLVLVPGADLSWSGDPLGDEAYVVAYVASIDSRGWVGGVSPGIPLGP